jgi:hypothetical protein
MNEINETAMKLREYAEVAPHDEFWFFHAVADLLDFLVEEHKIETAFDQEIPVEGGRATVYEDIDYCESCGDTSGGDCWHIVKALEVAKAWRGK